MQLPGPRPWLGIPGLLRARRDLLGHLARLQAGWGDVVGFRIGPAPMALLGHPDAIHGVLVTDAAAFTKGRALKLSRRVLGEGLLTSEGAVHRRQRRRIQPLFARGRLEGYAQTMTDAAAGFGAGWRDGATVDMARQMRRLTLCIVARTLFGGAGIERQEGELIDALGVMTAMFRRTMLPGARFLEKLPLPSQRRFRRAHRLLDEAIAGMIRRYRAAVAPGAPADGAGAAAAGTGGCGESLLSLLIDSRDDEGGAGDAAMTDGQVRDEAFTLFAAGHETTAVALAWTWLELAAHPEVEARLHREIDGVLGGRPAELADLDALPYTRQVLTESMRLHPPAYAVGRTAETDYRVGPWTIADGTTVLMSQYLVHRDPRFYADPLRFDPDRWTPAFRAALPRFAYFPFGGGPRVCIGEGFAWTEAAIVLATLAGRWRARLAPGARVEPHPSMTLQPRGGVPMILEMR